jgi:3-methyladenine DNA glycosylase/8-oxoguanine DNA glycosylase
MLLLHLSRICCLNHAHDRETTGPLFPTAAQVAATPVATLRTAGLSGRKAEYVRDLAARFADGRLSTSAIRAADDDALAELLIAVRGVGRWTGAPPLSFRG